MTNGEKFKSREERISAFDKFCNPITCDDCPIAHACGKSRAYAAFAWLELSSEGQDYKIAKCPYCGSECYVNSHSEGFEIRCLSRYCYIGKTYETKEEAIAHHNAISEAAKTL